MTQTLPKLETLSRKCRDHRVTFHGESGPLLVMVHGFGTDQYAWHHVLPSLAGKFRIVTLSLAGAGAEGASLFDAERYAEIEAHADDLLQMLDDLGIADAFYVGHSMGAMIGVLAAIEQPRFFRKLILLGASPRYLDDEGYVGGFDQPTLDGIFAAMSGNYHEWVSGFAPVAVNAVPGSAAVREFAEGLFALRPDIALNTARVVFQSDLRDRLPLLDVPVSILQMRDDVAVPIAVGEYLRDTIAAADFEVIAAQGHLPHLSAPAAVIDALGRHLI
jgi:sigma-B regulation protein RsbQ